MDGIVTDALRCQFQRIMLVPVDCGQCLPAGIQRHLEFTGAGQPPAVELLRVLDQRRIAARTHLGDHLPYHGLDPGIGGLLPVEQAFKSGIEIGVLGIQSGNFNHKQSGAGPGCGSWQCS